MRLDHIVQAYLRASAAPNASLKIAQRRVSNGDISVDGAVTREPKMQVVPGVEAITLTASDEVLPCGSHSFFLMHKPRDCVCQRHPRDPNVYTLIPQAVRREDLVCVGRLDRDTTGTLLFGTDGGLQSMLLFPNSRVWKTYTAGCSGTLCADAAERFRAGLVLEDGTCCAPATLEVLPPAAQPDSAVGIDDVAVHVSVTLHEGFFHQVKRMLAACGATVVSLHRERFGLLSANDLEPGTMRQLTAAERALLVEMLPVDRVCQHVLPEGTRRRAEPPPPPRAGHGEQRHDEGDIESHGESRLKTRMDMEHSVSERAGRGGGGCAEGRRSPDLARTSPKQPRV